ncbi:unnamed protein product, partial [Rotaria sp. Silwood2]
MTQGSEEISHRFEAIYANITEQHDGAGV